MISSMTGYGRGSGSANGFGFTVELRSVNHRYADINLRLPRELYHLEDRIRRQLADTIKRGRVEAGVVLCQVPAGSSAVSMNYALAESYYQALQDLAKRLSLPRQISLDHLVQLPAIMNSPATNYPENLAWPALHEALTEALTQLVQRRREEGDNLSRDLRGRCSRVREMVQAANEMAPLAREECRVRVEQKFKELLTGYYEENRVLMECAMVLERMGIDEELVRLDSHLEAFGKTLAAGSSAGRKLDFIAQEMFREVNTIGSKSSNYGLSSLVVEIKAELERMREQIQNIE
ncbi:MAG: YicC/YloC family endoribonuclease [Bacillota bacterium]